LSSWISKALNRTTGDSKTNHAQAKTQMNPPLEPKSKLKFFTSAVFKGQGFPTPDPVNAHQIFRVIWLVICLIDGL